MRNEASWIPFDLAREVGNLLKEVNIQNDRTNYHDRSEPREDKVQKVRSFVWCMIVDRIEIRMNQIII